MEKPQELQGPHNMTDSAILESNIDTKGAISRVEFRDTDDGDEYQLARLGKKQVLKVDDQPLRSRSCPADNLEELWILVHVGL